MSGGRRKAPNGRSGKGMEYETGQANRHTVGSARMARNVAHAWLAVWPSLAQGEGYQGISGMTTYRSRARTHGASQKLGLLDLLSARRNRDS